MTALEHDPLVDLLPPPDDWWPLAACRHTDPMLWFPGQGDSAEEAKRVCWEDCPVRERCLEYALEHTEKFGVWGGMSEKQRRLIRKERRRAERGLPVANPMEDQRPVFAAPKPLKSRVDGYYLSDEAAAEIRRRWENRHLVKVTQRQLGEEYGVTQQVISNVVRGKRNGGVSAT